MEYKKINIGIFASSQSMIDSVQNFAERESEQIFIKTKGLDDSCTVTRSVVDT